MSADEQTVIGGEVGAPSRYIDDTTAHLNMLAASFEDVQQGRIRASNRGDEYSAGELKKFEDRLGYRLRKAMEEHALWPWLSELKGLAGPRTARVIAAIGDPRRFPGQKCSEGHVLPPLFVEGEPCPITELPAARTRESDTAAGGQDFTQAGKETEADFVRGLGEVSPDNDDCSPEVDDSPARCPGTMSSPRESTGTRALWHYAGLHVVDGKLPQRRKGQQADWKPSLRTLAIGPMGLGDMIVINHTHPYREIYDETKDRKSTTYPPWRANKIAKTVAVKQFLGDLLHEWKAVV